ncbi:MAG: bifunctional metallophosphatase/5'-nucleotidase [Deltaproteobacteria bacterium]|nr:MAG: bifunctional metallophosphatase/5'-nucleotidase [Deltaproteobacteria bacterium]
MRSLRRGAAGAPGAGRRPAGRRVDDRRVLGPVRPPGRRRDRRPTGRGVLGGERDVLALAAGDRRRGAVLRRPGRALAPDPPDLAPRRRGCRAGPRRGRARRGRSRPPAPGHRGGLPVIPLLPSLLAVLAGCARPEPPTPVTTPLPPGQLILAHTNDLHAHYLPERAEWRPDEAALGGAVAIEAWVRSLRQAHGEDGVLYLDGGDLLTGTPLMELEERGVSGGAMQVLIERMGVQGWVLGNHEFDRGYEHTRAFIDAGTLPTLSANLRAPCDADEPMDCPVAFDRVEPWRIYEVNGLRVGVFGLTTSGLGHLTDADTMSRLEVVGHAEAARVAVAALEPQVDLVVGLTHIGIDQDRALAEAVDGIDLIVGGHSHTRMERPERVDDTWIVQAGCYGRLLGIGELTVEDGAITDLRWTPQELDPDQLPVEPDPELVDLVDGYTARLTERFSEVVGEAPVTLSRLGGGETPLGRWAADAVRLAADADVGVYNAGGLRSDLVAGPVTLGDLYDVFPFGNRVVTFELTGEELVGLLLNTAAAVVADNRGMPQLSGVHFEWRLRLGAPELVRAEVGGAPLDLARTYRVATNSFVADQWQRNLGVDPGEVEVLPMRVLDAARAHAEDGPIVDPGDPRAVQIDR